MDGWGWGRFVNLFIMLLFNFVFNLITTCSPFVALHALHGLHTCVDLIWVGLDCLGSKPGFTDKVDRDVGQVWNEERWVHGCFTPFTGFHPQSYDTTPDRNRGQYSFLLRYLAF